MRSAVSCEVKGGCDPVIRLGSRVNPTKPLARGLRAFWHASPAYGSARLEDACCTAPLTLGDSPAWAFDSYPCLVFDGSNDYAYQASGYDSWFPAGSFTVAMECMPTDVASNYDGYWVAEDASSFGARIINASTDGRFDFTVANTAAAQFDATKTGVTQDAWHVIICRFDEVTGIVDMYVDGAAGTTSATLTGTRFAAAGFWRVARNQSNEYGAMKLHSIGVWDYAWTDVQCMAKNAVGLIGQDLFD